MSPPSVRVAVSVGLMPIPGDRFPEECGAPVKPNLSRGGRAGGRNGRIPLTDPVTAGSQGPLGKASVERMQESQGWLW